MRGRGSEAQLLGWANYVLRARGLRAGGLGELRDGVLLGELVALLTGRPVGRLVRQRPVRRFDALQNVTLVLRAVEADQVRLVNLGPQDVVGGNEKLIGGLLWALVQHYLIADDGAGQGSPKQRLLQWVQLVANSYPGVRVASFRAGWGDGRALAAIVHFHSPDVLDYFALPATGSVAPLVLDVLARCWNISGILSELDLEEKEGKSANEAAIVALVGIMRQELVKEPRGEDDAAITVSNREVDRNMLAQVSRCAQRGDRAGTDKALAMVVSRLRGLDGSRPLGIELERALRDVLVDAVQLCQDPESKLAFWLTRRDLARLAAGLRTLELDDETNVIAAAASKSSPGPADESVSLLHKELQATQQPGRRRALQEELRIVSHIEPSQLFRNALASTNSTKGRNLAEDALARVRQSKNIRYPRAVLRLADELHDALSKSDNEAEWKALAEQLASAADGAEQSRGGRQLRKASSSLLGAAIRGDVTAVALESAILQDETAAAVERARAQRAVAVDAERVDFFIRDVLLLAPAHAAAVERSKQDASELRAVRDTTRDLVQLVDDLEEASKNVAEDDEISHLQGLAAGLELTLDDEFDLTVGARELAHDVKEDKTAAQPVRELKKAIPRLALAKLEKVKNEAVRKREGLEDDGVRLARLARGLGQENENVQQLRGQVSEKIRLAQQEEGIRQQMLWGGDDLLSELTLPEPGSGEGDLLSELDALEFGAKDLSLAETLGLGALGPLDLDDCLLSLQDGHNDDDEPTLLIDQSVLEEKRILSFQELGALEAPGMLADELDALSLGEDDEGGSDAAAALAAELEELELAASDDNDKASDHAAVDWKVRMDQAVASLSSREPSDGGSLEHTAAAAGALSTLCEQGMDRDNRSLFCDALARLVASGPVPVGQIASIFDLTHTQGMTALEAEEDYVWLERKRGVGLLAKRLESLLRDAIDAGMSAPPPPSNSALTVGKKLLQSVNQLAKGSLAAFAADDTIPQGFSGSLNELRPRAKQISHALASMSEQSAVKVRAIERDALYALNCVKHLASGFVRGNQKLLKELVNLCKAWAALLIQALKMFDEGKDPDGQPQLAAFEKVAVIIETRLVLICKNCGLPLSGAVTSLDGVNYHVRCLDDNKMKN